MHIKQCSVSSKHSVNVSYYSLISSKTGVNAPCPLFRNVAFEGGQGKIERGDL